MLSEQDSPNYHGMKSALPKTMDQKRKCSVNANLRYLSRREMKDNNTTTPDAAQTERRKSCYCSECGELNLFQYQNMNYELPIRQRNDFKLLERHSVARRRTMCRKSRFWYNAQISIPKQQDTKVNKSPSKIWLYDHSSSLSTASPLDKGTNFGSPILSRRNGVQTLFSLLEILSPMTQMTSSQNNAEKSLKSSIRKQITRTLPYLGNMKLSHTIQQTQSRKRHNVNQNKLIQFKKV